MNTNEKWVLVDDSGNKHGKPVYGSMDEALKDIPVVSKRLEESGQTGSLQPKQILES